jgi:DNA-binding NarL/FixJ family response regulator
MQEKNFTEIPSPKQNPARGPAPLKVCVVDDDPRFRKNLAGLLARTEGFACVGSFQNGEEALLRIKDATAEVVMMDINLPGMSGVECARRLKAAHPELQIIMLTVYGDDEVIFEALEAGAAGYLLKRSSPRAILEAIADVSQGGAPMSSFIARRVVQSFHDRGRAKESLPHLTPREEEILDYVAKGYINKEIADALGVALETIRAHLRSIYDKLHVRSRTEAAMKYSRK